MNQNSAASKSQKLQYHNFLQLVSKYLSKKLIHISKKFGRQNNNSRTQLSFVLHNKSSLSFLFRSMWPANTHLITRRKYTRKEWRCYVIIKQLIDAAIACKCKGSLNKVHFPNRRWSKKISWQRWIFLIFYICVFISYINNYYN